MSNKLTIDDSVPSFKPGEFERLRKTYPNRIPVFVQKYSGARHELPDIPKKKFLVSSCMTVREMLFVIRSQIKLSSDKALFIFIGGMLPPVSISMGEMYAAHRSNDGALRVMYSTENTFG
jgi:GABA(A) receptor-associated protein